MITSANHFDSMGQLTADFKKLGEIQNPPQLDFSPEALEQQQLVQDWLDKNNRDFVAHAIWPCNVDKVISSDALMPTEEIYRIKGEVEHETGSVYNARGISRKIHLTDDEVSSLYQQLDFAQRGENEKEHLAEKSYFQQEEVFADCKSLIKKLPLNTDLRIYKELREKIYGGSPSQEQQPQEQQPKDDILNAKLTASEVQTWKRLTVLQMTPEEKTRYKRFQKFLKREALRVPLLSYINSKKIYEPEKKYDQRELKRILQSSFDEGCIAGQTYEFNKYMRKLAGKYNCTLNHIQIAFDENQGRSTDAFLAHQYEICKARLGPDHRLLWLFHKIRGEAIDSSKLHYTVRTQRNSVRWSYGSVAVLRGNVSQLISGLLGGNDVSSGAEAELPAPWKNDGKFFSLELNHPDTLVIGPQNDLKPFESDLVEKKIKFAYFEWMSEEQKAFFEADKKA